MTVHDSVNYVLFGNPLSQGIWGALSSTAKVVGIKPKSGKVPAHQSVEKVSEVMAAPLWKLAGANINLIRLAGVSGAAAVILGAYGAHKTFPRDEEEKRDLKSVFDTANKYHFFHTLALLACPLSKRPALTGALLITGSSLFCGTCYYNALTGDKTYNRLAPIGGITLILAWLSFLM